MNSSKTKKNATEKFRKINDNYEMIDAIAGGTCGDVIKGRDIRTGKIVAMKKIKELHEYEGIPKNAMDEIKYLRELSAADENDNIINFIEVAVSTDYCVYLIFDYCEYDLQGILLLPESLTLAQVKCYFRQLLQALKICHSKQIIHRDLKPANILLTQDNIVKLCDFGLARRLDDNSRRPQTTRVITIWYRPPELLLGTNHYGTEVDIWSAGCILYEMITKDVLFRSTFDHEADEIAAILRIHGMPTPEEWTIWQNLPQVSFITNFKMLAKPIAFNEYLKSRMRPEFLDSIDLIMSMLEYDPKKRITVDQALAHPFISKDSKQFAPACLPHLNLPSCHQSKYQQYQSTKTKRKNSSKLKPSRIIPKS